MYHSFFLFHNKFFLKRVPNSIFQGKLNYEDFFLTEKGFPAKIILPYSLSNSSAGLTAGTLLFL